MYASLVLSVVLYLNVTPDGKFSLVGFDDYRTYIPNQLTYFYDKSAKKYIINAVELSTSNVDRYLERENYTLNYDGTVLVVRGYSSAHLALESRGLEYHYYNNTGRTTKQAYNATNVSVLCNCVNAHMYSQFVHCSVDGYPKLWNNLQLLVSKRDIVQINGSVNLAKPFLLRNKRVQLFTAEPFCS